MPLNALKDRLPDYAKDLKLNLTILAGETILTEQQKAGCFLASALAARNGETITALFQEFAGRLTPEALRAARAACAIMGMNNTYYRFLHLCSNTEYQSMTAGLRMNIIGNPGVDKADFELWCLAVSAMNGCGICVDSHEMVVRKSGISAEQVQAAVRIAATVYAVAVVMDGEVYAASPA